MKTTYPFLFVSIIPLVQGSLDKDTDNYRTKNILLRGARTDLEVTLKDTVDNSAQGGSYFSWDDYYCTMQALMNKDECLQTQTLGDHEWCQFCTLVGDDEDEGLCLSPQQANKAQESLPGKVSCETRRDSTQSQPKKVSANEDISNCNLKGLDQTHCLDPLQVGGSDCIWCDVGGLGGFCFPLSWQQSASRFLECSQKTPDNNVISSWDFFSSSCYRLASDHDTCMSMKDEGSNENCLWCDAYVFGLCLNPEEAAKVGSFLTCEKDHGISTAITGGIIADQ
jgi:hypothetical protein